MLIIAKAWEAWGAPVPLEQPWTGLGVNAAASLLNLVWATVLLRVGRAQKSPALVADGRHIMTDVITSVGVLAGLLGAIATGWLFLDPLLALIVAVNILWQGSQVIGQSVGGLMDMAVEPDEAMRIRDIISVNSRGAMEVHDLKTRIAGRATFIELHLVVDAAMSVGEAHAICDPHRTRPSSRNPQRTRQYPCRAGRRGETAARHTGRAVRVILSRRFTCRRNRDRRRFGRAWPRSRLHRHRRRGRRAAPSASTPRRRRNPQESRVRRCGGGCPEPHRS